MAKKKGKISRKKRFLILGLLLLIVAGVGIYFFTACNGESGTPLPDELSGSKNYMCSLTGTPEEHSGLDNVGAVIYTLSQKSAYSTQSYTQVNAAGVKQYIKGGKDYKDGVMIASTFSWSDGGMLSGLLPDDVSLQKFYGADKAVIRKGAVSPSEWKEDSFDRRGYAWNAGDPYEILEREEYSLAYGAWGTEFSDYIVNQQTVLEISPLAQEGGLYTLTIQLDPATAVEYYVRQMVTMGGLNGAPDFSELTMTLSFTADWTVQKVVVSETYSTKKMGFPAKCSGSTEITYSYDEADIDVSAYADYFANYADAQSTGTAAQEKGALDYLMDGVAPLLEEDTTLRLSALVGDGRAEGDVFLSLRGLDIEGLASGGSIDAGEILSALEVRARLGGLLLQLRAGVLTVQYGDLCGKLSLAALLSRNEAAGTAAGNGAQTLSEEVGSAESSLFSVGEDWTPNYIPLEIGFGGFTLRVGFTMEGEGDSYTWTKIDAEMQALGMDIRIAVEPAAGGAQVPIPDEAGAVDLAPYIEEIIALLQGKKYTVGFGYEDAVKNIFVDGTALVDLSQGGVRLAVDILVRLGALEIPVQCTLIGEDVWLDVYGFCVRTTLSEAETLLRNMAGDALSLQLPQMPQISAADVVSALLAIDYDTLFAGLSLDNETLFAALDVPTLSATVEDLFDIDLQKVLQSAGLSADTLSLGFDRTQGAFALSLGGVSLSLGGLSGQVLPPENFVVTEGVDFFLEGEISLKDEQLLPQTEGNTLQIGVQIEGKVRFAEGLQISLLIRADGLPEILAAYVDGDILFSLGGAWMKVSQDDWKTVIDELSVLAGKSGQTAASPLIALFGENGLNIDALFTAIRISVGEGGLSVAADLAKLFGEGAPSLGLILSSGTDGIEAHCDKLSLGNVTFSDVAAGLNAANGKVSFPALPESDRCANVFEFLLNAYTQAAGSQYIGLDLTYSAPALEVALGGRVQLADSADSAQISLYLDFTASVVEYTTDEAGNPVLTDGQKTVKGEHYLHLIIAEGEEGASWVYITYSTKAPDAPTALRVMLPVSQLFAAGKTVLPILSPILGIDENVYYYAFVENILNNYYASIHSGIFGVMDTEAWCRLLVGIVEEYAAPSAQTEGVLSVAQTAETDAPAQAESGAAVSLVRDDAGNLVVQVGGLSDGNGEIALSVSALKDASPVAAPADLTGYIDISTIAQLLQDLEYAYRYADGGGYRLSGTITLTIDIKIWSVEVPVDLDIRVGFEGGESPTEKEPYLYIRASVPKVSVLFGSVSVIASDTVTEIVIQDGTVYMLRQTDKQVSTTSTKDVSRKFLSAQSSFHLGKFHVEEKRTYNVTSEFTETAILQYDYRIMPLNEFFAGGVTGILDQVYYILNVGDTAKSAITTAINNGGNSGGTDKDAGEMVKGYLFENDTYTLTLSVGAIAGDDTLGDLTVKIRRAFSEKDESGADRYDLTNLTADLNIAGEIVLLNMQLEHVDPGADSEARAKCLHVLEMLQSNGADISGARTEGNFSATSVTSGTKTETRTYWACEDPFQGVSGAI